MFTWVIIKVGLSKWLCVLAEIILTWSQEGPDRQLHCVSIKVKQTVIVFLKIDILEAGKAEGDFFFFPAVFNVQPDDKYPDNAACLLPLLRYYADSRKMCVSVKVVWMKPVPKQYFILSVLLLPLFIAAIHYLGDSPSCGVHWYAGERGCKVWGSVPTRTFPSVVGRNLIESEKTGEGVGG